MLIPRAIAKALPAFCDDSSARYALAGVKIERDAMHNPLAVATDGKRLLAIGWTEPETPDHPPAHFGFSAIVAGKELAAAAQTNRPGTRAQRASKAAGYLDLDEQNATAERTPIIASNGESTARLDAANIEGRYPRWRDCFPEYGHESVSVKVDAKMLAELLQAIAGCTEAQYATLTFNRSHDAHKRPVIVSAAGEIANAIGLLMPVHGNRDPAPSVQWTPGAQYTAPQAEPIAA